METVKTKENVENIGKYSRLWNFSANKVCPNISNKKFTDKKLSEYFQHCPNISFPNVSNPPVEHLENQFLTLTQWQKREFWTTVEHTVTLTLHAFSDILEFSRFI